MTLFRSMPTRSLLRAATNIDHVRARGRFIRLVLLTSVLGTIVASSAASAQPAANRLTVEIAPSLLMIGGNTMPSGQFGIGIAAAYALTGPFELSAAVDVFDKTDPVVCTLSPDSSCDTRYLRAAGTIMARLLLHADETVTPYAAAGAYLTRWDGSIQLPFEQEEQVSGSGPSGVTGAIGVRITPAIAPALVLRFEVAALFDVEGGTGTILRAGIGWRP